MGWEPRLPIPTCLGTGTRKKAAEGKECDQHPVGLFRERQIWGLWHHGTGLRLPSVRDDSCRTAPTKSGVLLPGLLPGLQGRKQVPPRPAQ